MAVEKADPLIPLRKDIDQVDQQLLTLLNKRFDIALQIGELKRAAGQTQYYRPEREKQLLSRLMALNKGPLTDEGLLSIYQAILSFSRQLQHPLTVAVLGPEHTYSHLAALSQFGEKVTCSFTSSVTAIFDHLNQHPTHLGILPIRNSTTGLIQTHLDQLLKSQFAICAEIKSPISHCLLMKNTTQTIERIYAHQQSLLQCQRYLKQHYPNAQAIAVNSNTLAAQKAQSDVNAAAIASEISAETYGLRLVDRHIQDDPNNHTTFWVVGQQAGGKSGHDKTILLIDAKDKPGILNELLKRFSDHHINRLESSQITHPNWQCRFYVEVIAHRNDASFKAVLNALPG